MFYVTTLAALLAFKAFQALQDQAALADWALSPEGQEELAAEAACEDAQWAVVKAQLQAEQARWAELESNYPY